VKVLLQNPQRHRPVHFVVTALRRLSDASAEILGAARAAPFYNSANQIAQRFRNFQTPRIARFGNSASRTTPPEASIFT